MNGGLFPAPSTLGNYTGIQEKFDFFRLFANSLFIAGVKTAIAIYTSAALGFVFAKMRFRGRNLLFAVVMGTMMVPWAVTIIPQYDMMVRFGWQDTYRALIVPGLISAFGIFLMITDEKKQLLAVGLKAFTGQYGTDYGGLFAATSLAIVPVIVVYVIFQKQFIAGIASGSGK